MCVCVCVGGGGNLRRGGGVHTNSFVFVGAVYMHLAR